MSSLPEDPHTWQKIFPFVDPFVLIAPPVIFFILCPSSISMNSCTFFGLEAGRVDIFSFIGFLKISSASYGESGPNLFT